MGMAYAMASGDGHEFSQKISDRSYGTGACRNTKDGGVINIKQICRDPNQK